MLPPELERQLKQMNGVTEVPPRVAFFDYAEHDDTLSKASGRPRYRDVVYVEMRSQDPMSRDVFRRKMEDQDKIIYPKEWATYESRKNEMPNRAPPLWALPGLKRSTFEELRALGLLDCEKLMNYTGDLQELEPFREIATRIMEISNGKTRKRGRPKVVREAA